MTSQGYSIIGNCAEQQRYKCGYCKGLFTNYSHGMWAHTLTVQDYQHLIDRGWRRSGCYCYKPTMHQTCCPAYTIRCDALNFVLSKSQRKILKKFKKFLKNNLKKEDLKKSYRLDQRESEISVIPECLWNKESLKNICPKVEMDRNGDSEMQVEVSKEKENVTASSSTSKIVPDKVNQKKNAKPVLEQCSGFIKGKIMRRERKKNKMLAQGMTVEEINAAFEEHRRKNSPKDLEYYIDEIYASSNRFQNKLVRVLSNEFVETLDESAALYKKYQKAIHLSQNNECDKKSFLNFLVKSPLQAWKPENGPPKGYGSFHDQYWLDGKLIAVGVIDILPACISSVYFFYDPAYSSLSLGTFSSLREVYQTRQLNKIVSNIQYYYMGFYIHSCPKMRYKAKMKPSSLLCPETYTWCDIDKCIPKLDKEKYSRLNEDPDAVDRDGFVDIKQILILYKHRTMNYRTYRALACENDEEEVKQYAAFVGAHCAKNMLLHRQ